VFWADNPGFNVLHDFVKDALLQKNGVVKVWWEEAVEAEREPYDDLSDDAFALILEDPDVELVAHTERQVAADPALPPETRHDVVIQRKRTVGRCKVMAVPPEEFVCARSARALEDTPYCAHKARRAQSDLIADGYDAEVIDALPGYTEPETEEEEARRTVEN